MAGRQEWASVPMTYDDIQRCKALRAGRPGRNGVEQDVNRWVGDLGALALYKWLKLMGQPHEWLRATKPYSPDFKIGGVDIRVRCSKRARFGPADGIGLNERHRKHSKKSRYVFAVYDEKSQVVHLVGTMLLGDFLNVAAKYAAGELVPVGQGAGKLPDGTPLYDVAMTHAQPVRVLLTNPAAPPEPEPTQTALF